MGDPDAWLAKPQPTPELCRLYHGIDCRRCVDGFDLCDKLVTIEEHHNADAWRRAADERALRLAEFYRRTTRQPEPGKGQDDQQSRGRRADPDHPEVAGAPNHLAHLNQS